MKQWGRRLAINYYRAKFKVLSAVSKKKAAEIAFDLFCTPQFRYRKPLSRIFSEAEKLHMHNDGYKIEGYRWNRGGTRKVLIAHGFNSSIGSFDRYILPLVKKGYEVMGFDAPAHGRSSGSRINAAIYRDMILAIDKQYGPIRSFMAHSFGGLAVCLALEEIPHDESYRLALIAPATESRTAIDFFYGFMRLDEGVRKEFDDLIYRVKGKSVSWYSISRAVKNIKATIRWYHDENDDMTPWADAKKVKEQNHPHIRFVITKGLGHRRIYRDHQILTSIVGFL